MKLTKEMNKKLLNFGLILSVFFLYSTYVSSADSSLEADKELRAGILLLGTGDSNEALAKFLKVQELDPLNADAHYYLGRAYSQLGEFGKAISSYEKALQLNPEFKDVHFQLGVAYYRLKQYRNAVEELKEAEKYSPKDAMVYYYQGANYYGMKKYYKSVAPFRKVRELDSSLTVLSYYWEGVSLFQQGVYKKAEDSLQEAKRISTDPKLEKSINELLEAIKKQTKTIGFNATMGIEYDDNVTLQPVSEDVAASSGKEDSRAVIDAKFTGRKFSPWGEFGGSYSVYQSLHQDLSEYNVQDHTASIYFSADSRPLQPFIQYSYDYCLVDNDKFMEKHTLFSAMNIAWFSPHTTQSYSQYEKFNYFDSPGDADQNRTGYANTLGLNQFFSIMNDKGYIKVGGAYKGNNADGSDWDYYSWKAVLGLSVPLPISNTTLQAGGEYATDNFLNEDSIFNEKRKDTNLDAWLKLIYKINENWDASLSYKHITNNSNIDFYEYRRNVTSLFVNYNF